MRRSLLPLCLALSLSATVLAESDRDYSYVPPEALPMLNDVPEDQLSDVQRKGMAAAQSIFDSLQVRPEGAIDVMGDQTRWMSDLQRSGAAIADEALSSEREKVLEFLGIDDDASRVYIFASFGMPEKILQAYVQEAIWTGGIVVFRGLPRGKTIREFVTQDLYRLVGKKGASATIQIDPRLFDAFGVEHVPTIAYTEVPEREICGSTELTPHIFEGEALEYLRCTPQDESRYIKVSGGVTLQWALEQFVDAGFDGAVKHLEALAKAELPVEKTQLAFSGEWDNLPVPQGYADFLYSLRNAGDRVMYETPFGLGFGEPGLDSEEAGITPAEGL